ncbi:MAG: patatin-like phospholipase family protein [Actinomycetes bacterium]
MAGTGLVLGAGGVTGEAFHRGVLRALRDVAGWDARSAPLIVGTSAGALVAASLRSPGAEATGDRGLDDVAAGVPDGRLAPLPALGVLAAAARRPWRARLGVLASSVVPPWGQSTDFLTDGLVRRFGDDWPDRDLWVTAVRRRDGRRIVFGRPGAPPVTVAEAVSASCAVPGVFRPVVAAGEAYVDGGAHSPTNADALLRGTDDLDLAIVSAPMAVSLRGVRPTLDLSLRLLWRRYLAEEVVRLRRRGVAVWTFTPGGRLLAVLGVNPLRAERVDEVEELAYASACREVEQRLEAGGTLVPSPSAPARGPERSATERPARRLGTRSA